MVRPVSTKGTPHQVLLSAATEAALTGPAPALVEVGDADVAGRSGGVRLYALAGEEDAGAPPRPVPETSPALA